MSSASERARERLEEARLYFLLTRRLCQVHPLVVLDEVLDAGVDLVQVREPQADDRDLLEWVHDVRERCARHRVPVIVNNRVDVAILAGADGVHVGQADLPPRAIREIAGPELIVGLSTHNKHQLAQAHDEPVDYVGVGPVFDTRTKATKGNGSDWLGELLPQARHPAFAVGGVSSDTVEEAVAVGMRRAAVSSAVCGAERPADVVYALREALNAATS